MMFRQFTMHNAQFTKERWGCRGELRSPAIDFVILNAMKNLFSVILSLGKKLKGFREVGGIYGI